MVGSLTVEVLARYLAVLGMGSVRHLPVTASTLVLLHRAHALRFAHDTVWMSRRRLAPFSYGGMTAALLAGEGGACFQLNGAFAALLRSLGFEVTLHRSRVQNAFDSAPGPPIDAHVLLQVQTPDGPFLADVGLGAGLLEPVPLEVGTVEQGGYGYALDRASDPDVDWSLGIDRKLLGVRRTEWQAEPVGLAALEAPHLRDATDAESPFLTHLSAHMRTPDGSVVLNGSTLTTVRDRKRSMVTLGSAGEWESVLREVFHLGLPGWTRVERDRLWRKADGQAASDGSTLAAC